MQPMISYSINLEDVVLAKVFADFPSGFYVDVGANDPTIHSNTRHFYNLGWHGINIEPGNIYTRLASERTRDFNFPVAVSDVVGELTFQEYPAAHGYSGLEDRLPLAPPELLTGKTTRVVPVRRLRDIFAEVDPPTIDFMAIDVEGHERRVLLGNDWSRWRPRVVFLEAVIQGTGEPCHHLWEDILLNADYCFAYDDGLNRFYVRHEDEYLVKRFRPPCVFDRYIPYSEMLLKQELQRVQSEYQLVTQKLSSIYRGVGANTLSIGLYVARFLQSTINWGKYFLLHRKAA